MSNAFMRISAILAAVLFVSVSCTVDHRYDVEKITDCIENEPITLFEKGIVIPVGDVDKIVIDSLIEKVDIPEEISDILKKDEEGNYRLEMKGNLAFDDIMKDFNLAEMLSVDAFSVSTTFSSSIENLAVKSSIVKPQGAKINLAKIMADIDMQEDFSAFGNMDITSYLQKIGMVTFDGVNLNLSLEFAGLPDIGSTPYCFDVTITLPEYFKPNVMQFSGSMTASGGKASYVGKPVKVEGIDLTGVDIDDLRSSKGIDGKIKVKGSLWADNVEIDAASIGKEMTGTITSSFGDANGNLSIKHAQAKINYSVDNTSYVSLGSLSGLKEIFSGTTDFPDIQLSTDIKSNTAIPMAMSAKICEMKDNVVNYSSPLLDSELNVPYSIDGSIQTAHNFNTLDINPVFNNSDDSLAVAIHAVSDKSRFCEIETGCSYTVGADYCATLPIALGKDFSMNVSDTLDLNIDESVSKILLENAIGITADVENTIPIGVRAEISLLERDTADATKYSVIPLESPCVFNIAPKSNGKLEFVFKPAAKAASMRLTHIRLEISASSTDDNLKSGDYIHIKNLSLYAPDGISIDLGQMKEQNN